MSCAPLTAAICSDQPVLTQLAVDSGSYRTLFSLTESAGDGGSKDWLVVVDGLGLRAELFPDPLADLRTAASHGPGTFLAASRCGDDCFQPVRWRESGWQPLGYPIEFDPRSTLHFTYDATGTPWIVFHQLTDRDGVLQATAYRWDGTRWAPRGSLSVQGVGSPGASPDPRGADAILTGTGRFDAENDPDHWLPALPILEGSSGGHVMALDEGGAAYVSFEGEIASTTDGATWQLERWTPWPNPLGRNDIWRAGIDYALDRATTSAGGLALLWYDERSSSAKVHLTRWGPTAGWRLESSIPMSDGGATEFAAHTPNGWLLLGACHDGVDEARLDALVLPPDAESLQRMTIPLTRGWND